MRIEEEEEEVKDEEQDENDDNDPTTKKNLMESMPIAQEAVSHRIEEGISRDICEDEEEPM